MIHLMMVRTEHGDVHELGEHNSDVTIPLTATSQQQPRLPNNKWYSCGQQWCNTAAAWASFTWPVMAAASTHHALMK